jgi:hypothetical protein
MFLSTAGEIENKNENEPQNEAFDEGEKVPCFSRDDNSTASDDRRESRV